MFSFRAPAPTDIYTLSLHDALPISPGGKRHMAGAAVPPLLRLLPGGRIPAAAFARFPKLTERRSEEHTSELQSRRDLVCRLLLEKKKTTREWRTAATREHYVHDQFA